MDPQLERQVETIRNLVESYFSIVSKNIRDNVPKAIMHMMVNFIKDYLSTDLLPMIYSSGNQDSLMEESQQAALRREEMIRMYHTCKDALQLISEVSTRTSKSCKLTRLFGFLCVSFLLYMNWCTHIYTNMHTSYAHNIHVYVWCVDVRVYEYVCNYTYTHIHKYVCILCTHTYMYKHTCTHSPYPYTHTHSSHSSSSACDYWRHRPPFFIQSS